MVAYNVPLINYILAFLLSVGSLVLSILAILYGESRKNAKIIVLGKGLVVFGVLWAFAMIFGVFLGFA